MITGIKRDNSAWPPMASKVATAAMRPFGTTMKIKITPEQK
jgi:hypothetical protein